MKGIVPDDELLGDLYIERGDKVYVVIACHSGVVYQVHVFDDENSADLIVDRLSLQYDNPDYDDVSLFVVPVWRTKDVR